MPLDRLKFLAVHDTDPFARWEAGQQVATRVLLERVEALRARRGRRRRSTRIWSRRCGATSPMPGRDPAFAAEALALPSEAFLADQMAVVDVDAIHAARETARAEIGRALAAEFAAAYQALADAGPYRIDGAAIGRRALRNACLAYLAAADPEQGAALAKAQFDAAANMTDVLAALVGAGRSRPARARGGARAIFCRW